VRLLIATGTRNTIATSAHHETRRPVLIASARAAECVAGFGGCLWGCLRTVCSAGGCLWSGRARFAWLFPARLFRLAFVNQSLPYWSPRPLGSKRRVWATICACMRSV
jgi:hypothetical protein